MTTGTTLPALIAEEPLTPQQPILVLFGRDDGGKPRAAWFGAADAEAATAAATLMKLRTLPLVDDAHRALAQQLAPGRVFASGRAFTPYVRKDLYRRLVEIAGGTAGLRVAGTLIVPPVHATTADAVDGSDSAKPKGPHAAADRPADRRFVGSPHPRAPDEIGLGSVVLAHEGPDDGWWEAEVIGVNGPVFALRWRDYPTQPTILRKPGELALLPLGQA